MCFIGWYFLFKVLCGGKVVKILKDGGLLNIWIWVWNCEISILNLLCFKVILWNFILLVCYILLFLNVKFVENLVFIFVFV